MSQSPRFPQNNNSPLVMYDFYAALKLVMQGKKMTRIEWQNHNEYMYMGKRDEYLHIFTKNEDHTFTIHRSDIEAIDWIVIEEKIIN